MPVGDQELGGHHRADRRVELHQGGLEVRQRPLGADGGRARHPVDDAHRHLLAVERDTGDGGPAGSSARSADPDCAALSVRVRGGDERGDDVGGGRRGDPGEPAHLGVLRARGRAAAGRGTDLEPQPAAGPAIEDHRRVDQRDREGRAGRQAAGPSRRQSASRSSTATDRIVSRALDVADRDVVCR